MCSVAKPIIKQIRDNREALDFLKQYHCLQRMRKRWLCSLDLKWLFRLWSRYQSIFIIGRILERLRYMLGRQIIFLREHDSIMMLL